MSEKRFEVIFDDETGMQRLRDNKTGLSTGVYSDYPFHIIAKLNELAEENEQLRKENTFLDNENAKYLADNIRELELLEKLTKFLHECDLTNEQRALFHEMITEEDLQH